MSFNVGDQVWANYDGVYYPAIVIAADQYPERLEEGDVPVYFADKTAAALNASLLDPIEVDKDSRILQPEVFDLWDAFVALTEEERGGGDDDNDDSDSDASDDEDEDDEDAKARKRAEKKKAKAEEKARIKAEKKAKKEEEKRRKEAEKKEKKAAKAEHGATDELNMDGDDFAQFLADAEEDEAAATAVDMRAADRSTAASTRTVRRPPTVGSAAHLEQPVGRIAELQLNLLKAHYNTVLASDVAGGVSHLMPFYEKDYLATAERATQRRQRTERFLALALKRANEEGKLSVSASKALQETHDSLRNFDLTKAFALPAAAGSSAAADAVAAASSAERRTPAADAAEVRAVPRGYEAPAGPEKMKYVTRLYYRDQLTSIADGTSLVPVEPTPYRGPRLTAADNAAALVTQASQLGAAGGVFSQTSMLGGRFSSTALRSGAPPLSLKATADTGVMTQWRLFRELPPHDDGLGEAQFIPPQGALALRFDEAGQQLWGKAFRRTMRALRDNDKLILNTTAQTTEIRLGLNIGYNDIPAAGGPPAGPEDVEGMEDDRDLISRQLRALGETLERERTATQLGTGSSKAQRSEAAQALLELTQRAPPLMTAGGGQTQTQQGSGSGGDRPTQFNFHDFGAEAARLRQQREARVNAFESVEHGSVAMDTVGSHLVSGAHIPENPLTPVNYGYDLEEAYRTDVPPEEGAVDLRSLKSADLPSVDSLWEKGSIAAHGTAAAARAAAAPAEASNAGTAAAATIDPRKVIREIFLKEAKTLTTTLEGLLEKIPAGSGSATTGGTDNANTAPNIVSFRSKNGVLLKPSALRDIVDYLHDVTNVRAIVEKLTVRALEQLQPRLAARSPTDTSPVVTYREAKQLASSFRRQIERAHRVDPEGLSELVPTNGTRLPSEGTKSHRSETRSTTSRHSRSTAGVSVRSSVAGQRRSRERAYDE